MFATPSSDKVLRHRRAGCDHSRSEEHTSELQSQSNLVCRLLLEKTHVRTPLTCLSGNHWSNFRELEQVLPIVATLHVIVGRPGRAAINIPPARFLRQVASSQPGR